MLFTDLFESFDNTSDSLELGDEVLVTYPNQFQGMRGEITGFGRNKAFVIIEINGKEYSMHSSDVERLGGAEDWDDEDEDYGTFGDDERDELDEYGHAHDKVTFEVDSENAYNHIMQKYSNIVDWNGDYMTVPARYWPAVQELAFAAGGDVQEIELSEGAEFGAYYYEQLAQKVFDERPHFSTKGRANELVDYAWRFAVQDLGKSRARWEFNYDEDFLSDFVSSYAYLQGQAQGVSEDFGTMAGAAALGSAAAYGIGRLAGKMINKFDQKYDGTSRITAKKHKDSCACEKCRGSDNSDLKQGTTEGVKTPAQKMDFKRVMAGAMSRDEYNKKYSLGKYAVKSSKSKLDPTGVYHNLIKTVDEAEQKSVAETQLDELSPETLSNYKKAAVKDADRHRVASNMSAYVGDKSKSDAHGKEFDKRVAGLGRANKSINKLSEGLDTDQLAGMIAARLERLDPTVFSSYGVEYVLDAVREVAEFYAMSDFEELGTSDLGAMARSVVKQLKQREAHMNRGV